MWAKRTTMIVIFVVGIVFAFFILKFILDWTGVTSSDKKSPEKPGRIVKFYNNKVDARLSDGSITSRNENISQIGRRGSYAILIDPVIDIPYPWLDSDNTVWMEDIFPIDILNKMVDCGFIFTIYPNGTVSCDNAEIIPGKEKELVERIMKLYRFQYMLNECFIERIDLNPGATLKFQSSRMPKWLRELMDCVPFIAKRFAIDFAMKMASRQQIETIISSLPPSTSWEEAKKTVSTKYSEDSGLTKSQYDIRCWLVRRGKEFYCLVYEKTLEFQLKQIRLRLSDR